MKGNKEKKTKCEHFEKYKLNISHKPYTEGILAAFESVNFNNGFNIFCCTQQITDEQTTARFTTQYK